MSSISQLHEIRALLHAHREFSECILCSMRFADFGTTLELGIDYIWQPDGSVRPDDAPRLLVVLRFLLVEEARIANTLRPIHLQEPTMLNWGFAEIARVEAGEDRASVISGERPLHRVTVWREEGPWIVVLFSALEWHEDLAGA